MQIKQYKNTQGKTIKNHFILEHASSKNGRYILFQSYENITAIYLKDYKKLILNSMEYSKTTTKNTLDFSLSVDYTKILKLEEEQFIQYIENWIS